MQFPLARSATVGRHAAFTLVEVLVSMTVLLIILLGVTLLFNGAQRAAGLSTRHIDADAQARAVFDRMAMDFAQMVRRPDVDYYLKSAMASTTAAGASAGTSDPQPGSDQLAFYSQVPGYYPAGYTLYSFAGSQSPLSLVAYNINAVASPGNPSFNKLQRLGYGLLWNGVAASTTPPSAPVFSAASTSMKTNLANTLLQWPMAMNNTTADAKYEVVSAEVFRMEYSYLLRGQVLPGSTVLPSILSDTPWDTRTALVPNHTSVNGLSDVSAFIVTIALTDPATRQQLTDAQLTTLAAAMNEDTASDPGRLAAQWQAAALDPTLNGGINRTAAAAIHVYQRYFYLPLNPTP